MPLLSVRPPRAVRSVLCAAGVLAAAACGGGGDGGGVTPPPPANATATFNVAAQFVVAPTTTGLSLRATPAYELAAGGTRALTAPSPVTLSSAAAQTVPVTVDITSCLGDASRAGASTTGSPSCRVVIEYTLLSGTRVIDTQTSGTLVVASGSQSPAQPLTFVEVTGVQVRNAANTVLADAAAVRAEVGAPVTLTATALRADGATSSRAVAWTSDNAAVATVNATTGAITPVAPGQARVTASAGDARSAVVVTVVPGPAAVAVTVSGGAGSGTVTSAPAGINCRVNGGVASGTCSLPFASDAAVTLTAAPDAGTAFGGWGADCAASTTTTCTLTPASPPTGQPRSATVRFNAQRALTVALAGSGVGRVTSVPAGVDCSATGTPGCTGTFVEGAQVVLTAAAVTNSTFAGWSGGGCTGTGTCTVTLAQATTVTATFTGTPRPVAFEMSALSANGSAFQVEVLTDRTLNGTRAPSSGLIAITLNTASPAPQLTGLQADEGTLVTITARPVGGARVVSWGGVCAGTVVTTPNAVCTYRQTPNASVTITLGP